MDPKLRGEIEQMMGQYINDLMDEALSRTAEKTDVRIAVALAQFQDCLMGQKTILLPASRHGNAQENPSRLLPV